MDAVMTPFERNLDFWRQLWRVVERSDIVVQILDARDPLFFRSPDLEASVQSLGKKAMLVLNKADFLTAAQRAHWTEYFGEKGVDMVFFSALAELQKKELIELEEGDDTVAHGELGGASDVLDCEALLARLEGLRNPDERTTVGMVGYPNVGKSSLINALMGTTKVSVSRQPGKTKHFQTIEVPERHLRLCDCPGLVFPSIVATKAHLLIRGVQPIDVSRDHLAPCELIVEKMGVERVLRLYKCAAFAAPFRHESGGRCVLSAFAKSRGHLLKLQQPDVMWAARRMLKDYTTGALLFVELPQGVEPEPTEELEEVDVEELAEADMRAGERAGRRELPGRAGLFSGDEEAGPADGVDEQAEAAPAPEGHAARDIAGGAGRREYRVVLEQEGGKDALSRVKR